MKKLFIFLTMLVLGIVSSWATVLTLTPSNGTYVTSSGNYVNSITFSTTPSVTVTASANNMDKRQTSTYLLWHSGQTESSTYTITVDNSTKNYVITGFTVTGEANTSVQTLTVGSENHEFAVGTSSSFTVTGWFPSLSFVQTGANASGLKITSISVTIEEVSDCDWTPNIDDDACVTVGEKVATFTAATDKNDNEHWYILTQTRDGETPMYDAGAGNTLIRTGTGITTETINNSYVSQSKKYLVRFIETGVEGVYIIQFANGNYVTSSLTTNTEWQSSSTYAFYNSNSGSGSYFAWNLYNKNGKRVDNNGAGNYLVFWGAGETSGTSNNNIWYMYEAEINSTFYTYQISDASGVIYTSNPMAGTVGQTITELPVSLQRPYCTYNMTSTTIVSGKNTVPVTLTAYNPPFTVSSDFASATWYYATLRSKQLRADETNKDGNNRYQTNSTNERTDVYKWAFVGNPYQLSIINKGAGDSKVLYMGTQPVMKEVNPANDSKARWIVSSNSNGGFTVRSESGATMYINDAGNDGNLGYWNSASGANDGGSNWVVTAVPTVDVTYNLKWNSNTIKTATVSRVTEGENASNRVPWSVPAYCSFSYDVETIETTTTEVNVTMTWNGPFDFSTDFASAKWYYLSLRNKAKYVQMSTTIPYPDPTTKPTVSEGLWAFTGDPYNGVKVMNARAGDGKYLKKVSADNESAVTIQDGGQYWAIGVGKDGFYLKEPGNNNLYIHDYGSALKIWNSSSGATDNGSGFQVEEASPVKVTYKLTYNGNVISSYTKDLYELVGATAAAPFDWVLPAYCSLGSCTPATITAETTEVTIPLNWNGPFAISPDFENANWYYLKMHGQYLINYGGKSCSLTDLATAETDGYNAFWAFVGDPFNGFQLINKAAGSDKNLVVSWTPYMGDGETKWLLQEWNDNFALRTSSYLYLNNVDGQLKLYVSGQSTEATNFDCTIESASYRGLALAYLDEYAASHHMGEYFGVDESSYNTEKNKVSNLESMTEDGYNQFVSSLNTRLSPKLPETGYYRIKSSGSRGGESYISYGWFSDAKGTGLVTTRNDKMTDFGTIVKLTRIGTSENYQISLQGLNVQAHTADETLFTATDAAAVNFTFNHINLSGMCSINDGTEYHGYIHEAGWYNSTTKLSGVVGWGSGASASRWVVEDATACTVNLNSDGATTPTYYATFCAPFSYTVSDGTTKAYTLEQSGEWLIPTEIKGEVAAGTPVLLKGTSATATLTIRSGYAESPLATTALTGTYLPKTIEGSTDYVLGKYEGKVGFYHWSSNNLAANRAYLAAESVAQGARGFALMFEDDATGIVSTPGETEEGITIYNLSGQRLNKMQKGINIVNGKKVLF